MAVRNICVPNCILEGRLSTPHNRLRSPRVAHTCTTRQPRYSATPERRLAVFSSLEQARIRRQLTICASAGSTTYPFPSSPSPSGDDKSTSITLRIALAAAYFTHVSSLGVFGSGVAAISAKYHTLLTPAGWTFSIWGLIYALQGFGVLSLLLAPLHADSHSRPIDVDAAAKLAAPLWMIGWGCQTAWLVLFAREQLGPCLLALTGAMVAFLAALFQLRTLQAPSASEGPSEADRLTPAEETSSGRVTWGWMVPTSINAAWLTVAASIGLCQLAGACHVLITPGMVLTLATTLVALNGLVEMPLSGTSSTGGGGEHHGISRRGLPHPNIPYSLTLVW
eukprot:CAMPEP_0118955096 /NCGR_PEP_ID=MMETSP1169-20130426/59457_1 /TAXON_ID=36882 /ORGANISM="Pyramimonas obovata, Strain CCMP722" /LENGTH=336 /DNA_ID=CAMNT_0006902879 /DNA_START=135 /DNA_END=1142 /DNA_ORIENTATION=-